MRLGPALLALSVLCVLAGPAAAAQPTTLRLSAPPSVAIGEEIHLAARLTTTDGRSLPGVRLELRQVGAVGERLMAEAVTDPDGQVVFVHKEYTVPTLLLRVAYGGGASYAASRADAVVAVTGVESPPSVVMSHAPGPLVKGTIFVILGTIWLTYVYAATRVVRVALDVHTPVKGGKSG